MCGIIKSKHEAEECAFAAAARTDIGDECAIVDFGGDIVQDGLATAIAEADLIERQIATAHRQLNRPRCFPDRCRCIENAKDSTRGCFEEAHFGEEFGEPFERIPKFADVIEKNDERPDSHSGCNRPQELIAVNEIAAVAKNDGGTHGEDAIAGERIKLLLPIQLQKIADTAQHRPAKKAEFARFTPKACASHTRDMVC